MAIKTGHQPSWQVFVPTRGTPESIRRVHRNIVVNLPGASVTLILNPPAANANLEAGRVVAAGLGLATVDCPGGGVSRARNLAFELADRPLVVFLDDDVVVSGGAIETLVAGLKHCGAAVATARVVPAPMTARTAILWQRYLSFDRGPNSKGWPGGEPSSMFSPFEVWAVGVGATFAVNLPQLAAGTGHTPRFDERLSNGRLCGGTEDVDFFYGVHACGLGLVYVAEAVVEHLFPGDGRALRAKCRQYALADGAFYAKWIRYTSISDLGGELVGWARRVRPHAGLSLKREASIPLGCLLAEPFYKLSGVLYWMRLIHGGQN